MAKYISDACRQVVAFSLIHAAVLGVAGQSLAGQIVIDCQGTVHPAETWLFSVGPGRTPLAVHVVTGDRVEKGRLLVSLASGEGIARLCELQSARGEIVATRDNLQLSELEKTLKLKQRGVLEAEAKRQDELAGRVRDYIPESAQTPAKQKLADLEADLILLERKTQFLKERTEQQGSLLPLLDKAISQAASAVESLDVVAPFSGDIAYADAHPDMLPMGARVVELWRAGEPVVRCQVLQHQLVHIKPGSKASVTLDFSGYAPLDAVVVRTEPVPELGVRDSYPKFNIVLTLQKECPEWLRPGMKISAKIFPQD